MGLVSEDQAIFIAKTSADASLVLKTSDLICMLAFYAITFEPKVFWKSRKIKISLKDNCRYLALLVKQMTLMLVCWQTGGDENASLYDVLAIKPSPGLTTNMPQICKLYIHTLIGLEFRGGVTTSSRRESALRFIPLGQAVSRVLIHLFSLIFWRTGSSFLYLYYHDCQVFCWMPLGVKCATTALSSILMWMMSTLWLFILQWSLVSMAVLRCYNKKSLLNV